MLAHRGLHGQRRHKQLTVPNGELLRPVLLRSSDQPPEHLVVLLTMGEEQVLVNRMEPHHRLPREPAVHEILVAAVTEDPLDVVLPEWRITEAPFLFDRNQRKLLNKGPRK